MSAFGDMPEVEWVHGYWYLRSALDVRWCLGVLVNVARPGRIAAACAAMQQRFEAAYGAAPADLEWEAFEHPHRPPSALARPYFGNPRGFTYFGRGV